MSDHARCIDCGSLLEPAQMDFCARCHEAIKQEAQAVFETLTKEAIMRRAWISAVARVERAASAREQKGEGE